MKGNVYLPEKDSITYIFLSGERFPLYDKIIPASAIENEGYPSRDSQQSAILPKSDSEIIDKIKRLLILFRIKEVREIGEGTAEYFDDAYYPKDRKPEFPDIGDYMMLIANIPKRTRKGREGKKDRSKLGFIDNILRGYTLRSVNIGIKNNNYSVVGVLEKGDDERDFIKGSSVIVKPGSRDFIDYFIDRVKYISYLRNFHGKSIMHISGIRTAFNSLKPISKLIKVDNESRNVKKLIGKGIEANSLTTEESWYNKEEIKRHILTIIGFGMAEYIAYFKLNNNCKYFVLRIYKNNTIPQGFLGLELYRLEDLPPENLIIPPGSDDLQMTAFRNYNFGKSIGNTNIDSDTFEILLKNPSPIINIYQNTLSEICGQPASTFNNPIYMLRGIAFNGKFNGLISEYYDILEKVMNFYWRISFRTAMEGYYHMFGRFVGDID